jgi:hypothetical protein
MSKLRYGAILVDGGNMPDECISLTFCDEAASGYYTPDECISITECDVVTKKQQNDYLMFFVF